MGNETVPTVIIYVIIVEEYEKASIEKKSKSRIKDKIKLAASEKVFSGSSIAMNAALGANWCNAARAFMFSLGCVQSLRCHTGIA